MNRAAKHRWWFAWPLFAVLMWVGASADGQDASRDELALTIRSRLAELQQLQQEAAAEREAHARELESVQRQIERLERDVQRVRGDVRSLQDEVERKRSRLAELKETGDQAAVQVGEVSERAADLAGSLHRRSRMAIPSIQQLSDRIRDLAGPLRGDGTVERAEAAIALHDFVGDYLQSHRDRSIDNRLVELPQGDRARHAYVVRLGSVAELYLTEDGRTAGFASRRPDEPWRAPLDAGRHERVSRIVAVLREQAPPRLVETPLALPAAEEGE